jgi:hypothetical protein
MAINGGPVTLPVCEAQKQHPAYWSSWQPLLQTPNLDKRLDNQLWITTYPIDWIGVWISVWSLEFGLDVLDKRFGWRFGSNQ